MTPAQLDAWLIHTVKRQPQAGTTGYGDPAWGLAEDVPARAEYHTGMARKGDDTIAFDHRIFTTTPIAITDRLWLPGDYPDTTKARRPVAVSQSTTRDGGTTLYTVLI